ncbi:hypothetical protein AAE478_005528 [Parahypoxylon ruwenzoriense]
MLPPIDSASAPSFYSTAATTAATTTTNHITTSGPSHYPSADTNKGVPTGGGPGPGPGPGLIGHNPHTYGPSQDDHHWPLSDSNGESKPPLDLNHAGGHSLPHDLPQDLPQDQRTKKRRTGPSSRGVANLTPEQLAKKRANDREAQRAIRERTKNQIENLERRIRELTSQQPYQELQAAIRAKEAVEAENAEIKGRLAAIMSLIQPVLSNQQGQSMRDRIRA